VEQSQIEVVLFGHNAGINLVLCDRPEDSALRPLATGGFFGFWEKMQKLPKAGA
jgi:hypothetical protein